jgi:hypothetical protein
MLNRLTNMVDGVGTTIYGYDEAGQLLTEDGPWPSDTVSHAYTNRLRTSLSLKGSVNSNIVLTCEGVDWQGWAHGAEA